MLVAGTPGHKAAQGKDFRYRSDRASSNNEREHMPVTLTDRDDEILGILARKVRVLSVEGHMVSLWFPGRYGRQTALARMRLLGADDCVTVHKVVIPGPIWPEKPLGYWHVGDATPNFGRLAWRAKKRSGTPKRQTIVTATAKTKSMFGGVSGVRPIRTREIAHDAIVTSIYLTHFHPDPKHRWISEDELVATHGYGNHGLNVPDALIVDGHNSTALECIGSYSAAKLGRIHEQYSATGQAYALW